MDDRHHPHPEPLTPASAGCWGLCREIAALVRTAPDAPALVGAVPPLLAQWLGASAAYIALHEEGGAPDHEGIYPEDADPAPFAEGRPPSVVVPLVHGGQMLGVIAVAGEAGTLDPGASEALEVAAPLLCASLAEARQRRTGRLAAEWAILQRIAATIQQAANLEQAMAGTLQDLSTILLTDQAVLAVLAPDGEILHTATRHAVPGGEWPPYRELILRCARRAAPGTAGWLVDDLAHEPPPITLAREHEGPCEVRSLAAVPLHFESIERRGVLAVTGSRPGALGATDLAVLRRVALQVSTSLDHIIMSEQRRLFLDVQETLVTISRALPDLERGESLEAVLRRVVESMVGEAAQIHGAALHLIEDGEPRLVAACGPWPREGDDGDLQRWLGAVRQAWASRQPAQIGSSRPPGEGRPGSDPVLAVPLVLAEPPGEGRDPLGVLSLMTARFGFFVAGFSSVWAPLAQVVARTIRNMQRLVALETAKNELETQHEAILRSRNTLEALFESFPYGLYILDPSQRVLMHNGGEPQSFLGAPCHDVLPCRGAACRGCRLLESLHDGRVTKRTVQVSGAEGDERHLEVVTYPVRGEVGDRPQAAVVAVQDVTGERKLTDSLIRVEKFTAIGRLATTIAHEVNNPLSIVMLNAEILKKAIRDDELLAESADLVLRGAQRAAQAVRNLQSFGGDSAMSFGPTDLRRTVDQALALVAPHVQKHGGTLGVDVPERLALVRASAKHLEHVWATLILNSLDIMISAGDVGGIDLHAEQEDDRMLIRVRRSGPSIPPGRIEELFSPFGLTSLQGVGSGLGLYGCQQIVKQHGGTIVGANEPDGGFRFEIRLPLA